MVDMVLVQDKQHTSQAWPWRSYDLHHVSSTMFQWFLFTRLHQFHLMYSSTYIRWWQWHLL